ncbi:MAG: hypothetical protein Kow0042_09990 [Calditrichia bacterium]
MKPTHMFLGVLLSLVAYTHSQYVPIYVESSQGLQTPALEGGRTELELADVNNDGHLDILSIGDHGSPFINTQEHGIMVWFGDGAGQWSVFQYGNFGYGGIAVGDVNNDGLLDVGYGMHHDYSSNDLGDQLIEVALGDGTGMFWTPWDDGLATNGEDWGMFGTDFADIDLDGDLDIIANSFGCCAGVHVYRNNGDGTWTQSFGFIGGNSTDDVVFGDVNNDGIPDFAVAHQYGTVYLGDGSGDFTLADGNLPPAGSIGRYGPDLGDIDNDGRDELSFCNSNHGVEIWKWSEGNNWTKIASGLPSSGDYDATQIYDMDMDGFKDLAAFGDGQVTVWKGDGGGQWVEIATISLPSPGRFRAFRVEGDADHNGYPDIALVDEEGSWLNYQNHLRFFKEASPADSLSISPVFPGPGRLVWVNSVQTIRWISEVPAGDSSRVHLDLYQGDTTNYLFTIADSLPNNGHFQWQIPLTISQSGPFFIRYEVSTHSQSVHSFTPGGFFIGMVVDINKSQEVLADQVALLQNYPNPFNSQTKISFYLSKHQFISLQIFDIRGRIVKKLLNQPLSAGFHEIRFDAAGLASGVYYYQLKGLNYHQARKMVYIR